MIDKRTLTMYVLLIASALLCIFFYNQNRKKEEEYQRALENIKLLQKQNQLIIKMQENEKKIEEIRQSINADTALFNVYRNELQRLRANYAATIADSSKGNKKP